MNLITTLYNEELENLSQLPPSKNVEIYCCLSLTSFFHLTILSISFLIACVKRFL